jgi:hypothetical protein
LSDVIPSVIKLLAYKVARCMYRGCGEVDIRSVVTKACARLTLSQGFWPQELGLDRDVSATSLMVQSIPMSGLLAPV